MGPIQLRVRAAAALVLASVWIFTLAWTDWAVVPAMHCQRSHMPCCPRTGSNTESCSSGPCLEQVPEKAETQNSQADSLPPSTAAAAISAPAIAAPAGARDFLTGLCFEPAVFRLKDDLRI